MENLDFKKLYEEMKKERDEAIEKLNIYIKKRDEKSLLYYENNKEKCKDRMREYNKTYKLNNKTDPEKIKEYNKNAREKRKLKKLEEK